jgi:hypothetical protein
LPEKNYLFFFLAVFFLAADFFLAFFLAAIRPPFYFGVG